MNKGASEIKLKRTVPASRYLGTVGYPSKECRSSRGRNTRMQKAWWGRENKSFR